jgi:phenylacetate-CoA ligase
MMTMSNFSMRLDPFSSVRRAFVDRLPGHFERLAWPGNRLAAHQTAMLRRLLRAALDGCPFHARRLPLRPSDVDDFELADLAGLPVMTKAEMMESFDDLTTDRRLTRDTVDAFLAAVGDTPEALFGDYVVLASGGSSGRRGVG